MNPKLIKGGIHNDYRGSLRFFNSFDMSPIKRCYIAEHKNVTIVKAWQGHQLEQKWFSVIDGSFKVVLVEPDNWVSPSIELPFEEFILNANDNEILCVPAGFATGFQALETLSKLIIFSDVTLEESLKDDFRFDKELWYKWS